MTTPREQRAWTVAQIKEWLGLDKSRSYVQSLLEDMVDEGLVTMHPNHKGEPVYVPTEKGKDWFFYHKHCAPACEGEDADIIDAELERPNEDDGGA